jgi:hypothetical protein
MWQQAEIIPSLLDVMCTCNATSALTSGPLALDVLLIRLSCDLDLVASYYTNSWWFVQR